MGKRLGAKVELVRVVRMEGENTEEKNTDAVGTLREKADMGGCGGDRWTNKQSGEAWKGGREGVWRREGSEDCNLEGWRKGRVAGKVPPN
jgi:hypothetical protein